MKDFSKLRTELNEHLDVSHNSMPPNILILRRKTVRQFPNHVMVALYYNERLNQYFSIPYGGDADDAVITPVSLKEAQELMEDDEYLSHSTSRAGKAAQKASWMANFEKHVVKTNPAHSGKINWNDAHFHHSQGTAPEVAAKKYTDSNPTPSESHFHREEAEQLNEDIMDRLHYIRTSKISRNVPHDDGTKTMDVDAETAHAVLRHHSQLTGKAQEDFEQRIRGSRHTFGKAAYEARTGQKALGGVDKHNINEATNVNPIDTLRKIRDTHSMTHVSHDDGTKTHVDHVTAHMLLTVHDALNPTNQEKFGTAMKKSKPMFHKMVDLGWKQVK